MIGLNRKEKEKLVVDLYENGSQVLKTLLANDAAKLYSVSLRIWWMKFLVYMISANRKPQYNQYPLRPRPSFKAYLVSPILKLFLKKILSIHKMQITSDLNLECQIEDDFNS